MENKKQSLHEKYDFLKNEGAEEYFITGVGALEKVQKELDTPRYEVVYTPRLFDIGLATE